jgi:catechol 2,3-dioxygenase
MTLHPATTVDSVHLTISDLDRSVRFYEAQLGFKTHRHDDRTASLGAGRDDLLLLTADERAPHVRGTTGLYHFAVLVPSRIELARSLRRLVETGTVMQGFADHGVSEALYLADPDGNGIEIYRDRPRAEWPFVGGRLRMGTDPLDVDDLLRDMQGVPDSWAGLAEGTRIGHVHLHVSRLPEAEHFYVDVLGFEVMQRYAGTALFIAAGGYHHHIALNTWAGVGAPPPPAGAIGLRHFVVRLPEEAALRDVEQRLRAVQVAVDVANTHLLVRDPSQNLILLTGGR